MYINNIDPYRSSRIDAFAQQFMKAGGISNEDFLIIEPYSIGDVYHTLSLMEAFRRKHCRDGQKIHFICNPRCLPVANIFQNVDAATGLNCMPYEFQLEAFAVRYPLAPGFPVVTAPDMHADGWLGRLCSEGRINAIEAKKLILNIDFDQQLARPFKSEEQRKVAIQNAESQGLVKGSVIIFNHANTVIPTHPDVYCCLQEIYPGRVYYDHSVPNAQDIPWALPLKIPLDQVCAFAEHAGSVVALRSGIVDLLSEAECNLFTIYPNVEMIPSSFPDRASVAKSVFNFRLSNLGLRRTMSEHLLKVNDGENQAQVCENLATLVNRVISNNLI
jgi:hypothetical protein